MKAGLKVVALAFLLVCLRSGPAVGLGEPAWKKLDTATMQKLLKRGDLVSVTKSGSIELATIGMLVDAPPEKVWKVITDYKDYVNLMPECTKIKIKRLGKNSQEVYFEVMVADFGPIKISTDYTLKITMDKPKRVKIDWVKGKVKDVSGYWELKPVQGGKKTIAIYAITSNLKSASPLAASALKNQPATETAINLSSAVVLTNAVRKKAEK